MNQDYKKLIVWQKSIDLVVEIYSICKKLPKNEEFGLSSQMKRAAVSISSNIAEGSRRRTPKDKNQFLTIAFGSASELETQLEILKRINISVESIAKASGLLEEVLRMLNKLTSY